MYKNRSKVQKHARKKYVFYFQGTDITVAFETHHLSGAAETILPKYFVKKTDLPKNLPFTFKEDGFYRTLKTKVVEKLKEVPPEVKTKSDIVTDCLLIALIVISPLSCLIAKFNYLAAVPMIVFHGLLLCAVTICAHNYFHRRDNWRMYLFNVSGFSYE